MPRHQYGAFVEGFDSILYATSFPADNQVRLLAEMFYAFVYDSKILLSENMVFDNRILIRVLRKIRKNYGELAKHIDYVARNSTFLAFDAVQNGILRATYVCSSLSDACECYRKDFLTHQTQAITPETAREILSKISETAGDPLDQLVMEYLIEIIDGSPPWTNVHIGVPASEHKYKMHEQLAVWLSADRDFTGATHSALPEKAEIEVLIADPGFWMDQKKPSDPAEICFDKYFSGRSHFHASRSLWNSALGSQCYGRLEEYVYSAYMEALEHTVSPRRAIRTPSDIHNQNNAKAQQVMNNAIQRSSNHFEFRLSLEPLARQTGNQISLSQSQIEALEDQVLADLNELFADADYVLLQRQMNSIDPSNPNDVGKYYDLAWKLSQLVSKRTNALKIELQANAIANVILHDDTEWTRCTKELVPEEVLPDSNGNEAIHRD